jgi:hypothetical protein
MHVNRPVRQPFQIQRIVEFGHSDALFLALFPRRLIASDGK